MKINKTILNNFKLKKLNESKKDIIQCQVKSLDIYDDLKGVFTTQLRVFLSNSRFSGNIDIKEYIKDGYDSEAISGLKSIVLIPKSGGLFKCEFSGDPISCLAVITLFEPDILKFSKFMADTCEKYTTKRNAQKIDDAYQETYPHIDFDYDYGIEKYRH